MIERRRVVAQPGWEKIERAERDALQAEVDELHRDLGIAQADSIDNIRLAQGLAARLGAVLALCDEAEQGIGGMFRMFNGEPSPTLITTVDVRAAASVPVQARR